MTTRDDAYNAYEYTETDIAALASAIFEQLRLAYLEQLRALARQHGVQNPNPVLVNPELSELLTKAREDAESIANTYNNDLRRQIDDIYANDPQSTRADYVATLSSWGRERSERKSLEISMYTILYAANFGIDRFISRNNLQHELFRAVGGVPVCEDCQRIVAYGIVSYATTQEYPLPLHPSCSHEWTVVNATDISASGRVIWLGL